MNICPCGKEVRGKFCQGHNRLGTKWNENQKKNVPSKISETRKKLFKEGKLKIWCEGLIKDTDERVKRISKYHSEKVVSKETRKKHSIIRKNLWNETNFRKKTTDSHMKSYEESMGIQKAKECKEKKSKQKLRYYSSDEGIKFKKQQRIYAIKRIEEQRLNGLPLTPAIGKQENKIFNFLEKATGYKFIRQYKIDGYFLDGYCPSLKLAVEVDEKYHQRRLQKDLYRQNYIENKLNCTFIRINVGDEY